MAFSELWITIENPQHVLTSIEDFSLGYEAYKNTVNFIIFNKESMVCISEVSFTIVHK